VSYFDSNTVGDCVDLGPLWHELLAGHAFVSSAFHSGDRCLMKVERQRAAPVRAQAARIVERVLMGESQKVVAMEMGLAASTVAGACRDALAHVSCYRKPSQAPLLVVMAVHSACGAPRRFARVDSISSGAELVLSAPLPSRLHTSLTLSEGEVVRLVLEGGSHAHVARSRSTSRRTTANQLASAFRKLGISGMGALRSKLICEQLMEDARY